MDDEHAPADAATQSWWLYHGTGRLMDTADRDRRWPAPPPWRAFAGGPEEPPAPAEDSAQQRRLGVSVRTRAVSEKEANLINAAIYLRQPLLALGPPGSGRGDLAYRIARELGLGRVLRWRVTASTTLRSGLYHFDPACHATGGDSPDLGDYLTLGPLGTALLPYRRPRVLLITGLDQGDPELSQLLTAIIDDGEYEIPELARVRARQPQTLVHTADPGRSATIRAGRVRCHEFPLVVAAVDDEQSLPAALRRRMLKLAMPEPDDAQLMDLITAQFPEGVEGASELLADFTNRRDQAEGLIPEHLLRALHLRSAGGPEIGEPQAWQRLVDALWQPISPTFP